MKTKTNKLSKDDHIYDEEPAFLLGSNDCILLGGAVPWYRVRSPFFQLWWGYVGETRVSSVCLCFLVFLARGVAVTFVWVLTPACGPARRVYYEILGCDECAWWRGAPPSEASADDDQGGLIRSGVHETPLSCRAGCGSTTRAATNQSFQRLTQSISKHATPQFS